MASATVAAAGTAVALYYYYAKRSDQLGDSSADDYDDYETRFAGASFAPRTFLEDLYFFAEGLRYLHSETLGKWRTHDLLIGLSYLCRKDTAEHPVADIARAGKVFAAELTGEARSAAMEELRVIERVFRYCSGLRERRPVFQRRYYIETLEIPDQDILRQEHRAGVLKPSFVLTRDASMNAVVLAIRGTHSFKDAFTSLTGSARPHHMVDHNGVVLGYSHFGMLAAARWIKTEVSEDLKRALESRPGYRLLIVGHSLGGGCAALLTMMLREQGGHFAEAQCIAIACPACMTLELAKSCSSYVTTVVNAADVIPTICPGTADALREEVMQSSWFADFRQDVRTSRIVKVVENGLTRVGTATATATSWTTARLSACYPRRAALPGGAVTAGGGVGGGGNAALKRRNSDENLEASLDNDASADMNNRSSNQQQKQRSTRSRVALSSAAPTASPKTAAAAPSGLGTASRLPNRLIRNWDWAAGVDQITSFTGRQAQTFGRSVSATASRLAATTTSSRLFAGWNAGTNAEGAAAATEFVGDDTDQDQQAQGTATEAMMKVDYQERVEVVVDDNNQASDDDADLLHRRGSMEALGLDQEDEDGLEAEAAVRMREVEQAVSAAEAEEHQEAASEGDTSAGGRRKSTSGAGHDAVPAVIRPGSYGVGSGLPSSPSRSRGSTAWRRQMYPAGRILHLVPSRLVPGLDDGGTGGMSSPFRRDQQQQWPEAVMEDGDDDIYTTNAEEQEGNAVVLSAAAPATAAPATAAVETNNKQHTRHISELSMGDVVTSEEAAGSAAGPNATGEQGPLPPLKPALGPLEPMVLLDGVPQECYARIKLCRTVLSDHVIPNYLRSLESFVGRLQREENLVGRGGGGDGDDGRGGTLINMMMDD